MTGVDYELRKSADAVYALFFLNIVTSPGLLNFANALAKLHIRAEEERKR